MLVYTVKQRGLLRNSTAYRLALIHSTAVQTYNLCSKLATQTHHLHYPLQERHFPAPSRHAEKSSCTETEQCYLCRVLHFNRQNLMLINPPNDQATAYGTSWKYLAEH